MKNKSTIQERIDALTRKTIQRKIDEIIEKNNIPIINVISTSDTEHGYIVEVKSFKELETAKEFLKEDFTKEALRWVDGDEEILEILKLENNYAIQDYNAYLNYGDEYLRSSIEVTELCERKVEKTYSIPVTWSVTSYATVKASNIKDAIKKIEQDKFEFSETVAKSVCLEDTFKIDHKKIRDFGEEEFIVK